MIIRKKYRALYALIALGVLLGIADSLSINTFSFRGFHLESLTGHFRREFDIPGLVVVCGYFFLLGLAVRKLGSEEDIRGRREEQTRLLFEGIPLPCHSLDRQGCITDVNRAWCELTGYEKGEIIGRRFEDLIVAGSLRSSGDLPDASGEMGSSEFEMVGRNGKTISVSVDCNTFGDGDGYRTFCVLRNITEQKRNKEKFKSIVEQSHDGILLLDKHARIVEWNQALERMTGLRRSEVLGELAWDVQYRMTPPDQRQGGKRQELRHSIFAMIAPEGSSLINTSIEREIMGADGALRHVQAVFFQIHQGQDRLLGGVLRDITAQLRSEERFRSIVEQSVDGIALADREGKVIAWNQAMERITGVPKHEALGRFVWDVQYEIMAVPKKNPEICQRLQSLFDTFMSMPDSAFEDLVDERMIVSRDGEKRFIQIRFFPIHSGTDRMLGSIMRDETHKHFVSEETELSLELMKILNASFGVKDFLKTTSEFLQQRLGCGAIGIRLKDGDDYPYYVTQGFPREFVERESGVCVTAEHGALPRGADGEPALSCLCGRVLRGETDPSLPYFTRGGSFWTNNAGALMAGAGATQLAPYQRNTCSMSGYESIALVPLRLHTQTIGLLQFNDTAKNFFPDGFVELLEKMSATIAIGLVSKKAEEALLDSEERYRTVVENVNTGIALLDPDMRIISSNRFLREWYPDLEANDRPFCYHTFRIGGRDAACRDCAVVETFADGKVHESVVNLPVPVKGVKHVRTVASPIKDGAGRTVAVIETIEDISGRIEAEQERREYQEKLRWLTSELALAEESERRRIATGVHDSIGQAMALAKMKVGQARAFGPQPEIAACLNEIQQLLEQGIGSARTLSFELSPPVLYEIGFEAAVEWLSDHLSQQHGIAWSVRRGASCAEMDSEVRVMLYTIVRELMLNAIKHSGATDGFVRIDVREDMIIVEVEDNGSGFDLARVDGSVKFGLFSIRERLAYLGGGFDVRSRPGEGALVKICAPRFLAPRG